MLAVHAAVMHLASAVRVACLMVVQLDIADAHLALAQVRLGLQVVAAVQVWQTRQQA